MLNNIKYNLSPDNINEEISTESSNPNIVAITDGNLVPKAIGTSTITSKLVKYPNIKDSKTVEVKYYSPSKYFFKIPKLTPNILKNSVVNEPNIFNITNTTDSDTVEWKLKAKSLLTNEEVQVQFYDTTRNGMDANNPLYGFGFLVEKVNISLYNFTKTSAKLSYLPNTVKLIEDNNLTVSISVVINGIEYILIEQFETIAG